MVTKQEILDKMQRVKTWRELGLTLQEVYDAFSVDGNEDKNHVDEQSTNEIAELKAEIEELNKLNDNLRETNRKQRAELKKMRNGG